MNDKFNEDDNLNSNKKDNYYDDGLLDNSQIQKASSNVRFYNKIIVAAVAMVILTGAICGIYLYKHIFLSGRSGDMLNEPAENQRGKNAEKKTKKVKAFDSDNLQTVKLSQNQENDRKNRKKDRPDNFSGSVSGTNGKPSDNSSDSAKAKDIADNKSQPAQDDKKNNVILKNGPAYTAETNLAAEKNMPSGADTNVISLKTDKIADTSEILLTGTAEIAVNSNNTESSSEVSSDSTAVSNSSRHVMNKDSSVSAADDGAGKTAARTSEVAAAKTKAQLTNEISLASPAPNINTDQVELYICTGEYLKALDFINKELSNKNIAPADGDYLKLAGAKIELLANNNLKGAYNYLSQAKNYSANPMLYYYIYLYIFADNSPENCRKLLNKIVETTDISFKDEEKLELAKALIFKNFLIEAEKFIAAVVNETKYKAEISNFKNIISLKRQSEKFLNENKTIFKNYFTVDNTAVCGGKILVAEKIKFQNLSFNVKQIFSAIISDKIFIFCDASNFLELNPISGKVDFNYKLSSPAGYELLSIDYINEHQFCGLLKSAAGKYQLVSIKNSAFKKEFMPAYFAQKEFDSPFYISPDGKYAAFMKTAKSKAQGYCDIEIISLKNGQKIYSDMNIFFNELNSNLLAFNGETKQYSPIDKSFETKFLYFFKPADENSLKKNEKERGAGDIKLRLYRLNLETNDLKALFQVNVKSFSDIIMCCSTSARRLLLSYNGAAFGPQFGNFSGVAGAYQWILSELADNVFKVNSNFSAAVCCDIAQDSKSLNLFQISPDGSACKYIFKTAAVKDLLTHIDKLSKINLKSAMELISEFELTNPEMMPADAKTYEAVSNEVKKAFLKQANNEEFMNCVTLKRMGLWKSAVDRLEQYLKTGDAHQTKDLIELKEELRKSFELIKK
ncbi:MAG: hypothetical protein QMC67_10215 [Candidatus Wallbacteria bacterium]